MNVRVGAGAPGLSASTVVRLKEVWQQDYEDWSKRSLADKRYVYFWVDGIHFNIRLEEERQCILLVMGATPEGKKELVAQFMHGRRKGVRKSLGRREEGWLN
ncbi:MAG: transposase [Planctomycetes bacterium]|nr:transposase [Planctomycetota bacterium]